MSPMTLRLPARARFQIETWATGGYPEESCGLLVGRPEGQGASVVRAVRARNLDAERALDHYELDPGDFVAADLGARAEGLDIVGVWHTHPDHPAQPSATDRRHAWEGWSYVIARVTRTGVEDLRSFRLHGGAFVEEAVEP